MKTITEEKLYDLARFLLNRFGVEKAFIDFLTFGISTEYLRAVIGNEWTNQIVFKDHQTIEGRNRKGRSFMRAESLRESDRMRHQTRTLRLAELLFNLQYVEGVGSRVRDIRDGKVESTYAELEAGNFIQRRGIKFRFIEETGLKGNDYDIEIIYADGGKLNCEIKSKVEEVEFSSGALINPLRKARKQLPENELGIIFLKVPCDWMNDKYVANNCKNKIQNFLHNTKRIVAVILRWESQQKHEKSGFSVHYIYLVITDFTKIEISSSLKSTVTKLDGPSLIPRISFREIATNVRREFIEKRA